MVGIILLTPPCLADTQTYRTVDEQGRVIFSDKPLPNSKVIDIKEVQTISPERVRNFRLRPRKTTQERNYTNIAIINPKNEQAFAGENANSITVSIATEPALDSRRKDKLVLYLDGQNYAESASASFTLTGLHRGEHTIKADIVSNSGAILKRSNSVKFSVFRPIARARAN